MSNESNNYRTYNTRFYLESENRWLYNGETIKLSNIPQIGLHIDFDSINTYIVKDVCLVLRNGNEYYSVLLDYDNSNQNDTIRNKYWKRSWK